MRFRADPGGRARCRNRWRDAPIVIALLAIATAAAAAPTALPAPTDRATASHSFSDVDYWSSVFDDPERDAWQRPQALIAALQLRPGATVADLGAGTGYLSRHLAAAVGSDGTVLAIEVEPTLVAHLRERAQREQTANVVPILASTDNPRLPRSGVDAILIVDTYHHLDHRTRYLPQFQRARAQAAARAGHRRDARRRLRADRESGSVAVPVRAGLPHRRTGEPASWSVFRCPFSVARCPFV
jgi:predicted methyltransferase